MQYRTLGTSGLSVSPVCLGTMTFGIPVAENDAIRLVHTAIDLGINFIDTANVYEGYSRYLGSAGGVAELIVGKALRDRRDRMIITTKVGAPVGPGPQDRGLSPVHVLRELDRSLRRLHTDFIDHYVIHWPDKIVPLKTTLAALETAWRQGKIRSFGVSNHAAWQICELLWIAERRGGPPVVSSQIPLSLLRREFQNDLAFCLKHGIGVTPYQSLQGGLLTGKYRRGKAPPEGSRAAEKPDWVWKLDSAMYDRLEAIAALGGQISAPMTHYALAWTLAQPAVSSVVVGATRAEQIRDAVAASELTIPADHFSQLDALCPPPWRQPDPVRG